MIFNELSVTKFNALIKLSNANNVNKFKINNIKLKKWAYSW